MWRPAWWNEEVHGTAWDRVREVMLRDRGQTQRELHLDDHDYAQQLHQAVRHAASGELQPARQGGPTPQEVFGDPSSMEVPLSYGYGARQVYRGQHLTWDNALENKLRVEWENALSQGQQHSWEEVKDYVRQGYEYSDEQYERKVSDEPGGAKS